MRFQLFANYIGADIAANESIVDVRIRCANGPGATSATQSNDGGSHVGSIDGIGTFASRSQTPFIPSGLGANAQRWNLEARVRIPHNSNGSHANAIIRMITDWGPGGSYGQEGTYSMPLPTIPRTPTNVAVERLSDTSMRVTWDHVSPSTRGRIQRRINGGAWQTIYTMNTTSGTFTNSSGLGANLRVDYRVAGVTDAGVSAYSSPVTVYTTPGTPLAPAVSRVAEGIRVASASTLNTHATHFDIQDDGVLVASAQPVSNLPWVHEDPNPAIAHRYRIRGRRASGGIGSSTLIGSYSPYSATVELLAPPNPPTGLTPNGGVAADDMDVRLQWVHNPVDASDQSDYELRYREPDDAWTTLAGDDETFRDVPLTAGDWEWQVRTKGEHPDWSNWSSTATVEVISRPGVAITQPEDEWDAAILPVTWTWFQEQDRPQTQWQVQLLQDSEVIEYRAGVGAATSFTLPRHLTEGEWTVRVRGRTGDVWSDWDETTFQVVFDPPAAPALAGEWDEAQGGVSLSFGPVDDEVAPETVRVVLERSFDGEEWHSIAEGTEPTEVVDWESLSNGHTWYRSTSFTAPGAAAETVIVVEARSSAVWLSGGSGFEITGRLPYDPKVTITVGRETALKQYAGRSKPVVYRGEALSRIVQIQGTVLDQAVDNAGIDHLTELSHLSHPVFLFRSPRGDRIYGSISAINLPRRFGSSLPGSGTACGSTG
ncbi:hypothetical protein [Microbacterium sp. NIBRBAC000506063]|uniref:hypothetical protein n=1 Tax=Microbacterium sp. NIBRBAC000506063 TaxID=2734618 RepID=UPI001BB6E916|nr:hypothetical protein [Microbacterium sp. NIBRBAC000506063]QTV79491.1 hypothetical protein KAE78_11345 [Microbacterium sp. NIBRBAC000506063]